MRDISEYRQYFKSLAGSMPVIADFYYGDSIDIISAQRSEINYPAFWVETPDVVIVEEDSTYYNAYRGAFVILHNSALDDRDYIQYLSDNLFQIAQSVMNRFINESDDNPWRINLSSISYNSINTVMHDDDHGWRVEFEIISNEVGCDNVAKISLSSCPPDAFPRLRWEVGPGYDVVLEDTSLNMSGWSTTWITQLDDQPETFTSPTPPLLTGLSGTIMYVRIEKTSISGCSLVASARFPLQVGQGTSVPYDLRNV